MVSCSELGVRGLDRERGSRLFFTQTQVPDKSGPAEELFCAADAADKARRKINEIKMFLIIFRDYSKFTSFDAKVYRCWRLLSIGENQVGPVILRCCAFQNIQ